MENYRAMMRHGLPAATGNTVMNNLPSEEGAETPSAHLRFCTRSEDSPMQELCAWRLPFRGAHNYVMHDTDADSPMRRLPMHLVPRSGGRCCGARCRTGLPCRNWVMRNGTGRCRMHGSKAGRPPIHGRYTHAAIEKKREAKRLARALKAIAHGRLSRLDPDMPIPIPLAGNVASLLASAEIGKLG